MCSTQQVWGGASPWQNTAPQFSTTPVPRTQTSPTGCSESTAVCTHHPIYCFSHFQAPSKLPVPLCWFALSRDLANASAQTRGILLLICWAVVVALSHHPSLCSVLRSGFGFTLILSLVSETPPPAALKSRLFGSFPLVFLFWTGPCARLPPTSVLFCSVLFYSVQFRPCYIRLATVGRRNGKIL